MQTLENTTKNELYIDTHVRIPKHLRDFAVQNKISMSETLANTLKGLYGYSQTKELSVQEKIGSLKAELDFLQSEDFKKVELEKKQLEKIEQDRKQGDITLLRNARKKALENQDFTAYNRVLRAYCVKYSCELTQAVALAESKDVKK
jgi:hypothetical protein